MKKPAHPPPHKATTRSRKKCSTCKRLICKCALYTPSDTAIKPTQVAKRVDPEYFAALETLAKAVSILLSGSLGMIHELEKLARQVEALDNRQNRWRTDAEIERRL